MKDRKANKEKENRKRKLKKERWEKGKKESAASAIMMGFGIDEFQTSCMQEDCSIH